MPWRTNPRRDDRASVIAIRCPHCRTRSQRSGDSIPVYSVFSCHGCGARLIRQQSLVVALSAPAEPESEVIDQAV